MALNSLFRRVSASLPPLQFLPISRFSTFHDHADKLLGLVESGYNAQQSLNMNFPVEFPYGIEEIGHSIFRKHRKYLLRKRYQDEIIELSLDGYEFVDDTLQIPLNAHVLRGTQHLQFEMLAQPDQIDIKTCTIKDTVTGHVNPFKKFLEIRGFNSSMINSLVHFQQSSNVPDGFPFKIQVEHEKGGLFLVREFEDESIKTEVSGLSACVSDIENTEREFQMSVKIDGDGDSVEKIFQISVFPHHADPILIDELCIRRRYGHLGTFHKFWDIRGVTPSTINFLFDYFNKKAEEKYPGWTGVKLSPQTPTCRSGQQQI